MKPSKPGFRLAALLLGTSLSMVSLQTVQAEILYKWQEADGSLTFSPKPPPEGSGIAYELVTSAASSTGPSITSPTPTTNAARTISNAPAPSVTANNPSINTQPAISVRPSGQQRLAPAQRKSEHCNDLRNRVMSLERLLRTELTDETMDNAVVQMARYQTGIDRACK